MVVRYMKNENDIRQMIKENEKLSLLCDCVEEAVADDLPKLIHDDAIRMMRTYSLSYDEAVHIVSNNMIQVFKDKMGIQDDV